jgi:hypothetical protein
MDDLVNNLSSLNLKNKENSLTYIVNNLPIFCQRYEYSSDIYTIELNMLIHITQISYTAMINLDLLKIMYNKYNLYKNEYYFLPDELSYYDKYTEHKMEKINNVIMLAYHNITKYINLYENYRSCSSEMENYFIEESSKLILCDLLKETNISIIEYLKL